MAWVAVLLALLAVVGVGYLYYLLVHLDPMEQLQARQTEAQAGVARAQSEETGGAIGAFCKRLHGLAALRAGAGELHVRSVTLAHGSI